MIVIPPPFSQFSNDLVSVDKVLLRSIMIEVATFLIDLDRINEPALQRIASIALRQIHHGHSYAISHDQLVRRIRNLTTDDQDLFLEELKRLLVNMLSVSHERVAALDGVAPPPCDGHHGTHEHRNHRPRVQLTLNNEVFAEAPTTAAAADSGADEQQTDENEDLAEADQMCGGAAAEDSASSALFENPAAATVCDSLCVSKAILYTYQ